jgi:hypothetical protein
MAFWNTCVTETPDDEPFDFASIGLGQAFVGIWQRS